jgi:hypothetical protein
MDLAGTPNALLRLYDHTGEKVPPVVPSFELAPTPTTDDEIYRVGPDERMRFVYDLAAVFSFAASAPGEYLLQFVTKEGTIEETHFVAAPYRTLDSRNLSGSYNPSQYGELMGNASASVRLSVIESEDLQSPRQWLLIDKITAIAEPRQRLPSYSFPMTVGSTIENAGMDADGQVWVVLNSDGQSSLLVWRMHHLDWCVLVPPAEQKIDFGTTRARMYITKQNVVIAGVEGKEKFTSQSVWAMPPAGSAPPTSRPSP